jgi:competence/damage-inducible protein CinA-like protein
MSVFLVNTGTELLLGDVRDAHLSFIAQQILPLGLRVSEQRTVPDGPAIRNTLERISSRANLIFVTGGLGPTSDDITRDLVAELLGLELVRDEIVLSAIQERLVKRRIKVTDSILRQADVPRGARILPNAFGTAPGLFLPAGINPLLSSPHIFLLPGPPRELQPMFRESVLPILQSLALEPNKVMRRIYKLANVGESVVEAAVGARLLAVPGLEVGYCARPGEVDLRIMGDPAAIEAGEAVIMDSLGDSIFTSADQDLEEVIVQRLKERKETLGVAESCTGGLLSHRLTNVPGASQVFLAGYVTYSNEAKSDLLKVDPFLIQKHGAVSKEVACAMADGARVRSGATHAIATTGIAGPDGGSAEKPVGTVFVGLAVGKADAKARKFFFPTDRETFKQMVAQAAFELLRRQL